MFSKRTWIAPQSPLGFQIQTPDQNESGYLTPTYGKTNQRITKQFIEKALKTYNRPIDTPYFNYDDFKDYSSTKELSICLERSESSASLQKKIVSFNFDEPNYDGRSINSRGSILKRSNKYEMNQIESFKTLNLLSPKSSNSRLLGSSCSLASLTSFKSGLSNMSYKSSKISSAELEIKKYTYQVQGLLYKDQLYTDNIFSTNSTSLSYRSQDPSFKCISWMRLSQLFKNNKLVLFNKRYDQRNKLNSSIFETKNMISAMNKLRKMQGLLQHIFSQSPTISQYGIYCLKIRIHGIQKIITIDDNIPIISQSNKKVPAFINIQHQNQVQVWPFLLQKAYAKLYNTYQSLMQQQSVQQWMSTIIGHKVYVFNSTDEKLKQIISEQGQDCSYLFSSEDDEEFGKLQPSVSDQINFNLFNYSFSLSELSSKYNTITICSQRLNYSQKIQSLKLSSKFGLDVCMYKMKFRYGTNLDIGIWQKDIKHFRGIGYEYSPIRMILIVKEEIGDGYRWIQSTYSINKLASLRTWVSTGQYYLIFTVNWKNKPFELNIKLSFDSQIQFFTQVNVQQNNKILEEAACDVAQRFGVCKQVTDKVCIYKYIDRNIGMMMQSIHNQHNKIVASVRKGYKIISNNPDKFIPLTKKAFIILRCSSFKIHWYDGVGQKIVRLLFVI